MKKKIIYIIIILSGLIPREAEAQVGKQLHDLSIGVNAGWNINKMDFSPKVQQGNNGGINAGISARYLSEIYFNILCGVTGEINFVQRGWSEAIEEFPELKFKRTLSYIEVPFLAHLAIGQKRKTKMFIHLGPQFAYNIGDSKNIEGDWTEAMNKYITTEQHELSVFNKFDYGITGGLGGELNTSIGNFLLEGRYYFGLSDVFDSTKKGYFSRSASQVITIKMTYLFDINRKK